MTKLGSGIFAFVVASVVTFVVGSVVGTLTGSVIISVGAGMLVGFLAGILAHHYLITCIEEMRKTDTDQQTQIDDLKRELEEMKRKQTEPQS